MPNVEIAILSRPPTRFSTASATTGRRRLERVHRICEDPNQSWEAVRPAVRAFRRSPSPVRPLTIDSGSKMPRCRSRPAPSSRPSAVPIYPFNAVGVPNPMNSRLIHAAVRPESR